MHAPPPPALPYLIDEVQLLHVSKARDGLVAVLLAPDKTTHTTRPGDTLRDGEVVRITPKSIYFHQQLNDPTRLERYREVVKNLL
jgi:hypothetical protein